MLSAADLADFDLSGLSSGLQSMVVRQDRYRREAVSIGVRPDCPETYSLVLAAERDAAVLAELERLVLTVRLFAADDNAKRPAPASPTASNLLARALAVISGAPVADTEARALLTESRRLSSITERLSADRGREA